MFIVYLCQNLLTAVNEVIRIFAICGYNNIKNSLNYLLTITHAMHKLIPIIINYYSNKLYNKFMNTLNGHKCVYIIHYIYIT